MLELKPEHIVARDEVTAAAGTLAECLDVLREMHLDDAELRRAVARSAETLTGALERLLERRRDEGELPDAGQREAGQAGAVGLRVKTLFSADSEAGVVAANLLDRCDDLLAKIDRAQAFADENAVVDAAMAAMREATRQVHKTFQALC